MKPTAMLAAVFAGAAVTASGMLPATAQTRAVSTVRRPAAVRDGAPINTMNGPFIGTNFGTAQRLPEQGMMGGRIDLRTLAGPATVTSVSGNTLTFRSQTGVMAGIHMPVSRIQAMRLRAGTRLRFSMLNNEQFELQVIGGPLMPLHHPPRK